MKILIVGQTSSFWIKEYIKNTCDMNSDEVYLLYDLSYGKSVYEEYTNMGVNLIRTDKGLPVIGKIPKLRTMVNLIHNIKRVTHNKKFDIIEFQAMPSIRVLKFFEKYIFKYGKKIIFMYWGSDLLEASEKDVKKSETALTKASYILFDSYNLKDRFKEYFGDKFDDKFVDLRLGTTIFDNLDNTIKKYTKEECKEHFGISPNLKVIAVGYNGRKRQQHLKALRQVAKLPKKELDEICILLHMGYGLKSKEYLDEIEKYAKENFPNYIVIDRFLDKDETSMLRYATDIMLHTQVSDAFAGSIKEILYAGALLINPSWIEYSECDKLNIKYYEFNEWNEISILILKALDEDEKELLKNRKILYNNFSWEALKPKWGYVHGKQV